MSSPVEMEVQISAKLSSHSSMCMENVKSYHTTTPDDCKADDCYVTMGRVACEKRSVT